MRRAGPRLRGLHPVAGEATGRREWKHQGCGHQQRRVDRETGCDEHCDANCHADGNHDDGVARPVFDPPWPDRL